MGGISIGGSRSFVAFKQHIGRNVTRWNGNFNQTDAWYKYQSMEIFQKVDSVFGLLINDPVLFFQHILYNLFINLPIKIASSITFSDNLILPQGFYYLEYIFQLIFIGFLAFLILYFIYKNRLFKIDFLKWKFANSYKIVITISCFFLTPCLSLLLIFPNEWYLITIFYMLLAFISITFFSEKSFPNIPIIWFSLACFVLILISPVQKKYKRMLFETTVEQRK